MKEILIKVFNEDDRKYLVEQGYVELPVQKWENENEELINVYTFVVNEIQLNNLEKEVNAYKSNVLTF